MSDDPHGTRNIPVGTPVFGFGGVLLGTVREIYPHYLLVWQEGQHEDLNVPVHAIISFEDGKLQVSVNRVSASEVDHEETAHHLNEDQESR